ncbi:uncharacterized protein J4E79_008223 [Alternaria viburni]|uniref:uncharacterized protein n=1 Tax=Alternaria viburni TaxID=566460 RepID=UPI0020C26317|nr:uncharacterized protein J4E79_008223 [Alternaria viburni]KAI4655158.1 hypothetical protein J4E79_008223 [Alternaria viburni]
MSTTSEQSKGSRPTKSNNLRRRNVPNTRAYVNTLSPAGQVNKVLTDMANLKGGNHLRNWSASARKELAPNITIKVEVLDPNGNKVNVNMPKLAFFAASSAFRQHLEANPDDTWVKFCHKDVSLNSMRTIVKWLRAICTDQQYTDIPIPKDVKKGLELRLAAQVLGMTQYTSQIIKDYICGLIYRPVEAHELVLVAEITRKETVEDPIVDALANYVAYLCRYHLVSRDIEDQYLTVLAGGKCAKLLDAVKDHKVRAIAQNGWKAICPRPLAEL